MHPLIVYPWVNTDGKYQYMVGYEFNKGLVPLKQGNALHAPQYIAKLHDFFLTSPELEVPKSVLHLFTKQSPKS